MKKVTYKHSDVAKRKMKEAHKGQVISAEQRLKISAARLERKTRLGYINSPDTRRKLSEGRRGANNWNFGKPRSATTRRKIGDANRGRGGWRHSPEAKARMAISRSGSQNPSWKGGITTPERLRFLHRRRRIMKRGNGGSHTFGEWELLKARYNWTCPSCKRSEPAIKLTEDHIVPIVLGGSDNIENIQPLCGPCNSKKYTKIIRFPIAA